MPVGVDGELAYTAAGGTFGATGFRARIDEEGAIRVRGTSQGFVWKNGCLSSLYQIASELESSASVLETHLMKVGNLQDGERVHAYIVLEPGVEFGDFLRDTAPALMKNELAPDEWVVVRKIPLNALGEVDEQALSMVPVMAAVDLAAFEKSLRSESEDAQFAVVRQERRVAPRTLHVSDIAARWRSDMSSSLDEELTQTQVKEVDESKVAPAYSSGGPLEIDPELPTTLTQALIRTARIHPDKGVMFIDVEGNEDFMPYAELLENAKHMLAGFQALGMKPEDRVMLQVDNLRDHFTCFWGG